MSLKRLFLFGGTAKQIVVDNMLTAVTERQGSLIRFNGRFLEFLRPFKITPVASHVRAAHEKGKIESVIKYLRYNFLPLRSFKDFAVRFDGNTYTAPPCVVGKSVTVKADSTTVAIYLDQKRVAVHQRSWERKKRIELPDHRDQLL